MRKSEDLRGGGAQRKNTAQAGPQRQERAEERRRAEEEKTDTVLTNDGVHTILASNCAGENEGQANSQSSLPKIYPENFRHTARLRQVELQKTRVRRTELRENFSASETCGISHKKGQIAQKFVTSYPAKTKAKNRKNSTKTRGEKEKGTRQKNAQHLFLVPNKKGRISPSWEEKTPWKNITDRHCTGNGKQLSRTSEAFAGPLTGQSSHGILRTERKRPAAKQSKGRQTRQTRPDQTGTKPTDQHPPNPPQAHRHCTGNTLLERDPKTLPEMADKKKVRVSCTRFGGIKNHRPLPAGAGQKPVPHLYPYSVGWEARRPLEPHGQPRRGRGITCKKECVAAITKTETERQESESRRPEKPRRPVRRGITQGREKRKRHQKTERTQWHPDL